MSTATENKKIRAYIADRRPDVLKVYIRCDESVESRTDAPRGDGGKTPWMRFEGWRNEILADMEFPNGN